MYTLSIFIKISIKMEYFTHEYNENFGFVYLWWIIHDFITWKCI
jgi:hypothetical protein